MLSVMMLLLIKHIDVNNKILSTAVEITVEDMLALKPKARCRAMIALLNLRNSMINRVDLFSVRKCRDSGIDVSGLTKAEVSMVINTVRDA